MKRHEAAQKAKALVEQMTLEEKASQLLFYSPAIPRLNIPAYNWWNEALHGVARAGTATVFPQAIALAAAFDEDLMEEIADCISTEGRAKYNAQSKRGDHDIYKGITFWSPNVNIFRDPRWGRGHETYGEDPFLTSRLGVRFVEGLQGTGSIACRDGKEHPYLKTAACAKHFAVHSGPEALRHEFNAVASPRDMEETYLPAFEACVKEAGVEAVMGAYNRTNGEVCCGSPKLQEILRGKWGFEGHFVSDCWAVSDFHKFHHVTSTPEESAALALKNGTDVNCGCTYEYALNAVDEGLLDEAFIDQSCIRLLTTRFLLGMFDSTEYDDIPYTAVECEKHLGVASKAALESIVLLKNNGILPLSGHIGTIGVIGPNADSRSALKGNYHGTSSEYITVLEGIRDYVRERDGKDAPRVLYSEGCHLFKDNVESLSYTELSDRRAEALAVAECSDLVILVVGLDETLEGEEGDTGNSYASGDKRDLLLPESQRGLMHEILECGKPVIVVNMSGSSIDLGEAQDKAAAILQAWYPGGRGGADVASILFGSVSPSGKLPVTFYHNEDLALMPEFTDYSMKGRTYRYFTGTPLYPFGYGLTYGDCKVSGIRADITSAADAKLFVDIENEGAETDDVLQIYIKAADSPYATPNPKLCAFRRVRLGQGEKQSIEITLPESAFTTVSEDGTRSIFGKSFTIYAGFSQPDARSEQLTGHKCALIDISL